MRKWLRISLLMIIWACRMQAQSSPAAMSINNAIQDLSRQTGSSLQNGESFVSYHGDREPPKGSRLLFDSWPKGFVLGIYDTVLNNANLFLNYDKITHNLYLTFDGKTIVKVESSQARELHFKTDSGQHIVLTRVDGIDPYNFFQRLSDSAGASYYVLYRVVTTQFHRANLVTDGLVTSGNNYDEYVDNYEYYLVMPGAKEYTPINLKKKSIIAALGPKAEPAFFRHHKSGIDEAFLIDLVNRLNAAATAAAATPSGSTAAGTANATGNAAYDHPQTSSPSR